MAFAVNIDPAESDPATLTGPELRARFGTRPLLVCESPEQLAETMQRLREGTSLWEWFLAAVLIGLVLEVFLANRRSGPAADHAGTRAGGAIPVQSAAPGSASLETVATTAGDDVRGFLESLQQEASRPNLRG